MIDPDLQLDAAQSSELIQLLSSHGFKVMQLVMQSVLETFRVDLDNADHAKPDEVLAKHALSKAAGIYYTRLVDRLNLLLRESSEVAAAITADPQADITEGVVDLDDIKRVTENMPNFFGDVTESDLQ